MARLRISELIEKRGITAYRLAMETGITHSSLSKMRHGQIRELRLDAIDKLCAVLECGVAELIEVEPVGGAAGNGKQKTAKKKAS